jgi:hypothetical protein
MSWSCGDRRHWPGRRQSRAEAPALVRHLPGQRDFGWEKRASAISAKDLADAARGEVPLDYDALEVISGARISWK